MSLVRPFSAGAYMKEPILNLSKKRSNSVSYPLMFYVEDNKSNLWALPSVIAVASRT